MNLFVITGIDGCGKSTQINLLANWLRSKKVSVFVSKAYNCEAKVILRTYINNWDSDLAIMFLFQALHAQQYAETIRALNDGKVVLADRWDESYLAYHSNFGELSEDDNLLKMLNHLAFKDLLPNLGFLITVPVEVARKRRKLRGKIERFESRPDEYFDLIQKTYISIARERGWHIIDGGQSETVIHAKIIEIINEKLQII